MEQDEKNVSRSDLADSKIQYQAFVFAAFDLQVP
jgi:hypothetical protein